MIKVWGRKTSSNVQALMWRIGDLGLEHIRYDIGHRYGGTDTPEFIAMNPNKTIPVLQDGENAALWETGAVLRYLANQYGDDLFWPKDFLVRTNVDKWAEWAKLNVASGFTVPVFWNVVRTAPKDRDHETIQGVVRRLEQKLQIADQRLQTNSYLAGSDFTLADIQFGHILFRYYDVEIERAELSALRAYYDRLTRRPAFVEHVMISYKELQVV
ncbi:MAG: glutathione S-transferase [Paracoccaceae bacterium]